MPDPDLAGVIIRFRWSVSGGGLQEETHRQVRFWRWVGNFLLVGWLFLQAPEAEIVVLVVVEVADLDDLEVIRFVAMDNISSKRIAREDGRRKLKNKMREVLPERSRKMKVAIPRKSRSNSASPSTC